MAFAGPSFLFLQNLSFVRPGASTLARRASIGTIEGSWGSGLGFHGFRVDLWTLFFHHFGSLRSIMCSFLHAYPQYTSRTIFMSEPGHPRPQKQGDSKTQFSQKLEISERSRFLLMLLGRLLSNLSDSCCPVSTGLAIEHFSKSPWGS